MLRTLPRAVGTLPRAVRTLAAAPRPIMRAAAAPAAGIAARSLSTSAESESHVAALRERYFQKPTKPNYNYRFLESPATVKILAYPFSGGQPRVGVDRGPEHMLESGLEEQLSDLGWAVEYDPEMIGEVRALAETGGDDADIGRMKNPRVVSAVNERLEGDVAATVERGVLPLTLGGDHSLAMGSISGTKKTYPDAAVIWVDAHSDINSPLTTGSGNLHGCPVSFLLGLEGTSVPPFNVWLDPCLDPSDIVYIGLRDIDAGEKMILRENGIKVFTMHHVDKLGIGRVMEKAFAHIGANRPIHLSFDVDALDPTVAPSTGTPVRGGLTFREGHYIVEAVAETGNLVALDVVEVNPDLADEAAVAQTVAVGCSLARAALGETLL